jgi:hypothetical protein
MKTIPNCAILTVSHDCLKGLEHEIIIRFSWHGLIGLG